MAKTCHSFGGLAAAAAAGVLVAVGMLLLTIVVMVEPAGAAFPGKPGKIAYRCYDGKDYEICTIKPAGGGRLQLTNNDTDDFTPFYSPSGKRIIYYSGAEPTREIYTIKPDGGGRVQVTNNTRDDLEPSWGSS